MKMRKVLAFLLILTFGLNIFIGQAEDENLPIEIIEDDTIVETEPTIDPAPLEPPATEVVEEIPEPVTMELDESEPVPEETTSEPDETTTPPEEEEETPLPEVTYYCGLEEHTHTDECFDEEGNNICGLPEHSHTEACLAPIVDEPSEEPSDEPSAAPVPELISLDSLSKDELAAHGVELFFSGLMDSEGNEVQNGDTVITGNMYTLKFNVYGEPYYDGETASSFFHVGTTYTYKLPSGIDLQNLSDEVHTEQDGLYSWRIVDGEIQFWFNQEVIGEVQLEFDLSLMFDGDQTDIQFGDLQVKVSEPAPKKLTVNKQHYYDETVGNGTNHRSEFWDLFGAYKPELVSEPDSVFDGTLSNKIVLWEVDIEGGTQELLSYVQDTLHQTNTQELDTIDNVKPHHFTDEDQQRGVLVRGVEPNGTIHWWFLNALYTSTTWNGNLMEQVTCLDCSAPITPDQKWKFALYYTSTIDHPEDVGLTRYANTVNVGGEQEGSMKSSDYTRRRWGTVKGARILKTLENEHDNEDEEAIVLPDENGDYVFKITAVLPGTNPGEDPVYGYVIEDCIYLWGYEGRGNLTSDMGSVASLFEILQWSGVDIEQYVTVDATTSSGIKKNIFIMPTDYSGGLEAYDYILKAENLRSEPIGISYRLYKFDVRGTACSIRSESEWINGDYWYNRLWDSRGFDGSHFCRVWDEPEEVTITLTYRFPKTVIDQAAIDYAQKTGNSYKDGYLGGMRRFVNEAILHDQGSVQHPVPGSYTQLEESAAYVPYQPIMSKEMVEEPSEDNDFKATYEIRVNEQHMDLRNDELTIYDEMSGMEFIEDSVQVWEVSKEGAARPLGNEEFKVSTEQEGTVPYTFKVTFTGNGTNAYQITYQTYVISSKVNNVAWGNFYGEEVRAGGVRMVEAHSSGSMKSNKVVIHKTNSEDMSKQIEGATYGLFLDGRPQAYTKTDSNGVATFASSEDLLLINHVLYYIQETETVEGYLLNDTKYWIVFCGSPLPCSKCARLLEENPDKVITIIHTNDNVLMVEVQDEPEPTPTPTPEPTDTPTPEPTDTPEPTATPTPVPTDTPEPTATSTLEPTDTPKPTDTPEPTNISTPKPTDTPEPTDTPKPTDTPTPSPTPTVEPTEESTPVPTDTPEPSATPTPKVTNTPTPRPTNTPTIEPTPVPTDTPEPTPMPMPIMISIGGNKTWKDNNDADGVRPSSITVRLLRNGEVYQEKVVTAADNWHYEFTDLLDRDPETGEMYEYSIREQMINGYYAFAVGYDLTNVRFTPPEHPTDPDDPNYTNPAIEAFSHLTEEELEDVIELFDYGTPLWGPLLQTGDEIPVYPFVFAAVGFVALLVLWILGRKRRR